MFSQVERLAEDMLCAAENDNEPDFYRLYDELKALCLDAKGTKKDHPVLWETLGDFSEGFEEAINAYTQAFELADALKDNEYKASILYAMAQRYVEENRALQAQDALTRAAKFASFTEDDELKAEITELMQSLSL